MKKISDLQTKLSLPLSQDSEKSLGNPTPRRFEEGYEGNEQKRNEHYEMASLRHCFWIRGKSSGGGGLGRYQLVETTAADRSVEGKWKKWFGAEALAQATP